MSTLTATDPAALRGPVRWWRDHFFPATDPRRLAVLRILFVALHLTWFNFSLTDLRHFLGATGFLDPQAAIRWLIAMGFDQSLRTDAFVTTIWSAMMIAGAFAFVGLGTRFFMPLFAILNILCISFHYSFGEVHHGEAIFSLTLLAISIAPCNRCYSIDSLIARRRGRDPLHWGPHAQLTTAYWPIRFSQWLIAIGYFEAFNSKWSAGGIHWMNGYTLQHYLLADSILFDRPWSMELAKYRWVCVGMAAGALLLEGTFWIIMFDRFRLVRLVRPLYVVGGFSMHLMIYVLQGATFWPWMTLYATWIPWEKLLDRRATQDPAAEAAPPVTV